MHIETANEIIRTARKEDPTLFNEQMNDMIAQMIDEAIDCEMTFAEDMLQLGVAGLSAKDMRQYLEFVADQRLEALNIPARYHKKNPFPFMELQDMQELANFFERRVSAYQMGVTGQVSFDESF
jgi:ribonucleoside-diphosphate reductase beta chain